jgi:thiosulfate/3-mercaptopyruvate sulfurtransferase
MMESLWLLAVLTYARPELIVTTEWVAEHLDDPNVRIVDTRTRGYEESHIPGAVWLDINASRDKNNPPTFLPDIDTFVTTIEELGISSDTHIVFYDDRGGIYGTRPWVLLRMLGHENASIVDGGWPEWMDQNRPVTSTVPDVNRGSLEVEQNDQWLAVADDVESAIDNPGVRLMDARTDDEFAGSDLRNNPRGGVIPTATHLFWEDTLEDEYKRFRPAPELAELFEDRGLSQGDEIITYCQGGGRAAHELFMLTLMGYDNVRLYMGSMEDWSRQPDRPLE